MNEKEQVQEVDKFFQDLPTEDKKAADIFGTDKPAEGADTKKEEGNDEVPEKDIEARKNRRHRRWETRLAERERELELEAVRLQAIKDAREASKETGMDERLIRLYGPENTEAIKLTQELLADTRKAAREEAIRDFEERQAAKAREEAESERFIDSELEAIEDEFNIDLTSDSPKARRARTEFLTMVSKLSPKDAQGNIISYADFQETWEIYQSRATKEKNESAAKSKELAARSMEQSGGTADTKTADDDAARAWLRQNGIRV